MKLDLSKYDTEAIKNEALIMTYARELKVRVFEKKAMSFEQWCEDNQVESGLLTNSTDYGVVLFGCSSATTKTIGKIKAAQKRIHDESLLRQQYEQEVETIRTSRELNLYDLSDFSYVKGLLRKALRNANKENACSPFKLQGLVTGCHRK